MPLLKKKSFEKVSQEEFLRDDEEVFYCHITNEIFRNYDEFAERMLLCTSMVWTCAMTGKNNLTYEEALESEEQAKRTIKELPKELQVPLLYVGNKTKRTGFGEMAEDVFLYCKDRYFIGEKLEACFSGNKWIEVNIVQVLAPRAEEITKFSNKGNGAKHSNPPFALYKYEVEHFDAEDTDISEIMIVDYSQIRRRRSVFNREKSKLFLKQYVEQDKVGHFVIRPPIIKEFGIDKMKFDDIFSGPEPVFESSKRFDRSFESKKPETVNGKKPKQETLVKYLKRANGSNEQKNEVKKDEIKNNGTTKRSIMLGQMEKRREEFEKIKKQREEEKLLEKQKRKKEVTEISNQLKKWNKPKDDLELEDQKPMPELPCVESKIPNDLIRDVLMILEFIKSFEKLLKCRNFFTAGVTFELMERALLEEEVAGPFIDLIQMLLSALFREQEEENTEYSMQLAKATFLNKIDINNLTLEDASKYATIAAKWVSVHQGLPVRKLPLYNLTVTEILRIHFLSSGARLKEPGERGRFTQRGGYSFSDDPGLLLRIQKPHILKELALKNVVQMNIEDKLSILSCLTEQLLTYANYRDVIEDRIEKNRQLKLDVKNAHISEKKRESEYNTARFRLKRDGKTRYEDPKVTTLALEKLQEAEEQRKLQTEKQLEAQMKAAHNKEIFLGMDRAFRKYYKLESVPGLFIDAGEEHPGSCFPEQITQHPELINGDKKVITDYLRNLFHRMNGSDKENSPSTKSPKKINGGVTQPSEVSDQFWICSADGESCIVHSQRRKSEKFRYIPDVQKFEDLMDSLNKRGLRESELFQVLSDDKETIEKFIKQTSLQKNGGKNDFTPSRIIPTRGKKNSLEVNKQIFNFPEGTSTDEILLITLTDDILELEEKIYIGGLGHLLEQDRKKWRHNLLTKNYKNFNREIVRREFTNDDVKMEVDEDIDETKKHISDSDPGIYLGPTSDDYVPIEQSEETRLAVECLAIALAHIAHSVEPKFLQKPLGDSSDKILATYVPSKNRLERWESSLLKSTSFSQVYLHYSTLDSCVMWSRSTLVAKCKICKRQKDSENMLLCDSCNLGHHLYCLKPKLTSIPKGDWFCDKCTAAKEKEKRKLTSTEVVPKKRRRLFREEEHEEEEQQIKPEEEEPPVEEEEVEEDEKPAVNGSAASSDKEDEEDDSSPVTVDLCEACNNGGFLIKCEKCHAYYHKECANPPLRKSKPNWLCENCTDTSSVDKFEQSNARSRRSDRETNKPKYKEVEEDSSDSDNYPLSHHAARTLNNERRSAAKARHNIYNFIKSLRRLSSSDKDSNGDDTEEEEPSRSRSQRKRSFRKESGRDDLPLHNAALQDLLTEIMKHNDAWPFLRPVQKIEVPDYYDVITNPMDFGTIKYKLNMGEYTTDSQLMYDVALIFKNCNTYNEVDSEIYGCGERLLKSFRDKCSELGLKIPLKNDDETPQQDDDKRRRI